MARTSVNQELANAPLPQMVEKLGTGIADAQFAMDNNSLLIAQKMGDVENYGVSVGEKKRSLLELGFTPTFYQITEASIEAKVAFSASKSSEFSIGTEVGVNVGYFAASVNASYSAKYSFEASGSSMLSTKFRAVPAPAILSDIIATEVLQKDDDSDSSN